MNAVKVRPLHPHAALLLQDAKDNRFVAVSDLHIGFESELGEKGVSIGKSSADQMVSELSYLVKQESADGIVLLGDIKHKVGTITRQEWDDIPSFLKSLAAVSQVYLVPGNHDGNIRHLVPQDVNLVSSKGMVIEDTLLVHGHSMPSEVRAQVNRIVMGHIHPVFLKTGSLLNGERVWIHIRARKEALFAEEGLIDIVVVPSLNPYLYASGAKSYHRSISPIMIRIMENARGIESCIVATLDGAIVGDSAILKRII